MDKYEINKNTFALIYLGNNTTQIIDDEEEFIINDSPTKIIERSCQYFGSSLTGRLEGTKHMIDITHKAPIIIEETNDLVFFPTHSPNNEKCSWINAKNILHYYKNNKNDKTIIKFSNGIYIEVNVSYGSIDNQILRATRLINVLRNRKEKNNHKN